MSILSGILSGIGSIFGIGGGGKSLADNVVDVVKAVAPTDAMKQQAAHTNGLENAKLDAANVNDARAMQLPTGGADRWESFVNGLNKLPRPLFSFWAFAILIGATFGLISSTGFQNLDTFSQQLIKIIIEFFFGVRVVSQDIPNAVTKIINGIKGK